MGLVVRPNHYILWFGRVSASVAKEATPCNGHLILLIFPNVRALVADSRKALRDATTACAINGRPPSTTGIAIDYRIRYSFAVTPPRELITYQGAADALSNVHDGTPQTMVASMSPAAHCP